eukprot:4196539-Amphidinium_carterae.1
MVSQVPEVPAIGAVQEVHTSTQSSSTEGSTNRTSRRDSADYWENIVDCMHDYYNDENEITAAVALEGVLYWMKLDEIENLQERARGESDPEAKRDYEMITRVQTEESRTLKSSRRTAWEAKDEDTIRTIVYQYASGIRE